MAATKKRKTRELAMQVLYLWDAHAREEADLARQLATDESEDPEVRQGALDMARATWAQRELIDARVDRLAPNWPVRRQPPVDRNLIRLAVWELTAGQTPPKVVIDEAIELAKAFSTEQSPAFVNGVLDAVLREHRALTAEGGQAPAVIPPISYDRPDVPPAPSAVEPEPEMPPPAAPPEPAPARPADEGPRDIAAVFDTDLRPVFLPDRRIDDPFLAALEVSLMSAGAEPAVAGRISGAVRSRWQTGQLHTTEEAMGVVREQVLHTLGGR